MPCRRILQVFYLYFIDKNTGTSLEFLKNIMKQFHSSSVLK